MPEELPDFVCTACDWQGDEPLVCGHCSSDICPKCGEEVITGEEDFEARKRNARDEELEDRRLWNHKN